MEFTALELDLPKIPEHIIKTILEKVKTPGHGLYNPCDKNTDIPASLSYIEDITKDQEQQIHDGYMHRELNVNGKIIKSLHLPRFPLEGEALDWINSNITSDHTACSVGFTQARDDSEILGPHVGLTRAFVLMYLVKDGGDTVSTRFFQMSGEPRRYGLCRPVPRDYSQLEIIDSHVFNEGKWYILNESILHDIQGIKSTRVSVQLSLGKQLPKNIEDQIPTDQKCHWITE